MPNRLAASTLPYLLQHKDNPVDWFPWGEAAFAEARRRDVPVFLSVGYSTCYWCHVMERQVFENEALAKQMNEAFVNVKVDREERPDVDEHYMTATQVVAGQGGWPMSVLLTPQGEPFYAGTYFPPEDMPGRPGFGSVIVAISEAWRDRRDDVMKTAAELRTILERLATPAGAVEAITLDDARLVALVREGGDDYEPRFGGFGSAPKFPRETLLETLLLARTRFAEETGPWSQPLIHTLDAMAHGGIRDHLGGGFHRYSTDAKWLVPHFEIMLYDQGMLLWVYAEAYRQTSEARYARTARGIADFVLREMSDDGGAFWTAYDAEVDAVEGDPYTWTPQQVEDVLGADRAGMFAAVYGLDAGFNFADPHGPNPHSPDRNVLFLAQPDREADGEIEAMRAELLAHRHTRKQPRLDDKILTSWNGLMIRGLAHAGVVLGEPRYIEAAERSANWLLRHHRGHDRGLLRSSRDGQPGPQGFLDDYAHLGRGLSALARATDNRVYQDHAAELADVLRERFSDARGGYFFDGGGGDEPGKAAMVRRKPAADSPLPGGNASAALLALELDRTDTARTTIECFAGQLIDHPANMSAMLEAAMRFVDKQGALQVAPTASRSPEQEARAAVTVAGATWINPQRLAIDVEIASGFHVYAQGRADVIPIGFKSAEPSLAGIEPPVAVGGRYTGRVRFFMNFSKPVSDSAVEVSVSYQACDASRCLMPVTQQFTVAPPNPGG